MQWCTSQAHPGHVINAPGAVASTRQLGVHSDAHHTRAGQRGELRVLELLPDGPGDEVTLQELVCVCVCVCVVYGCGCSDYPEKI